MTASEPTKFGKYWLTDRIAVGGMAELYRGKISGDEGFEKAVAVKKILPHLAAEKDAVNYFIDEARLAALLQHPNIAQIYDFGRLEDAYFIAMEYLFGKDLKSVLHLAEERNLPLSLENALHITSRICSGLDYAHNMKDLQGDLLNIIHRDVSPQNIFITYDGQVKIIDFGIAKAASRITSTRSGVIKGKVAYMSPEQAEGLEVDHRADIFSVGILLYEMVTGRFMYDGDAMEILSRARDADFTRPERIVRDLPECVILSLDTALAKDTRTRYSSCGEMLSDLEDCIYHLNFRPSDQKLAQYMKALFENEFESEEASMTRALRRVMPTDAALETAAADRPGYQETMVLDTETATRRSRRWLGIALCLLILVAGGAFWFLNRPGDGNQDGPVVVHVPIDAKPDNPEDQARSTVVKTIPPGAGKGTSDADRRAPDPQIAAGLKAAEQHLQAWNLTSPSGRNAYDAYRKVLKIDPGNAQARKGIKKVAERYADLADKEIKRGNRDKAMGFIKTGLGVDAANRRLWALREKINLQNEQVRQKKIQGLLVKANERIASLRLTKPPRDNALYFFREVQKIDPGNTEAKKGLRKIADRYATLAEKEMNRFRYDDARRFIDTGLRVDPRHEKLLMLKTEVNKRLDQRVMRSLKNIFN
ncbi:MAG: protein kinase [Desulfobacterales bacterium]|nr:protein kinase [Desulfobacterales bacterium]